VDIIKFERLFSEFKLKNISLRNRIVWLPHYTALANMDGTPSEREIYYYAERSKGGVGLIVYGGHAVMKSGQMHRTFIDASNEIVITNFSKTVEMVHKYGAKIIGQLTHAGPTKMERPQGDLWAPSQIIETSAGTYTMEMDLDDIKDLIKHFKKSSQNLLESGFDGVEIKVAHDGLLRAFLSPHYNKRTDKYGGSLENRLRISSEIFSAVREAIGKDLVLGVRLCMDEFEDDGYKLEEAVEVAKYLEKNELVDYINSDCGTYFLSYVTMIPPMGIPLGYAEYMSAALKREVKIPVIAFGRINDPVQAEKILENESADLIGMARQLLCDPETANKAMAGDIDGIRKCIACEDGCVGQTIQFEPIRCIQNPAAGKEKYLGIGTLKKSKKRKKFVVVGGGVSGMKFAEISAKRGNDVILFEKGEVLGGQLNLLKKIPYRNEFSEVIRYLEMQIKRLGNIKLKLGIKAGEKEILNENPDVVVVATGAETYMPEEFTRLDGRVFSGWDVLNNKVIPRSEQCTYVIYDMVGKEEGIGIAEYIFEYYPKVKILFFTPLHHAGQQVHFLNINFLYRKLFTKDFSVFPNYDLFKVKVDKLIFINPYSQKEKTVNNYNFLINIGYMKSVNALFKNLKEKVRELYRLGDSKAPRLVELAIHDAEALARSL